MAKHGVSWEMHLRNILSETSIKKKKGSVLLVIVIR